MIKPIILFCIIISSIPAQTMQKTDSLFALILSTSEHESETYEGQIMGGMYAAEYDTALAISEFILKNAVRLKSKSLLIQVLIHSYRLHPFEKRISMLNQAVELSKSDGFTGHLAAAYTFKSISFRDNSMPDSAMIYALMAKDILLNEDSDTNIDGINQLIADMHFFAGEYDTAEKIYREILDKEAPGDWHQGYNIIRNNIGLIKMKQKKFEEAERYFLSSYTNVTQLSMNMADSTGMAYLFRKLMEANLAMGIYDKAEYYFIKGQFFAKRFSQFVELPGLYIGYSTILIHRGKYDSSLIVLKIAEDLEKEYPDLKNKIELNRVFSDTYKGLGDYKKANFYLEQLVATNRTADSIYNRARILHIYAEHNYLNSVSQIENYIKEKNLILALFVMTAVSLGVFMIYFLRLRRSYRLLVEKNVELAFSDSDVPIPVHKEYEDNTFSEAVDEDITADDSQKQKRIVDDETLELISNRLEKLITAEKVYLNPDLTTTSLSEALQTNRTYLSHAIHHRYNMAFPDLINGYRVREAIKLMSSEESANLNIDGLAEKSGFNNRVTFSKIFQQHTGVSPAFFMKNRHSRP